MADSEFLKVGLAAAKKAEDVIMSYYNSKIKVDFKADQTPVTAADKGAEAAIIKTVKEAFPDHGFLGEESKPDHADAEYVWVIDPIDATKNFMRKNPVFATQLALKKNNDLILGISNAPALKELICAEKGKGAYLNQERITVSKVDSLNKAFLVYGGLSWFEKINKIKNLLALNKETLGHRGFGDFWGHQLVAQGKAEFMVEPLISFWDIAAFKVIIEEAGGKITDWDGNPVTEKTNRVVSSNGILHNKVLDYFK